MTYTQQLIPLLLTEFGPQFHDIRSHLRDNPNADPFSFDPGRAVGIAIHHTASGETQSWADVNDWHCFGVSQAKPEPWNVIAYGIGISESGVFLLRDLEQGGNHVFDHNDDLLAIAFLGNFLAKNPPAHWLDRATRVIVCLDKLLGKQLPIQGHKRWAHPARPTTCPGPFLDQWAANFVRPVVEPAEVPEYEWDFWTVDKATWHFEQLMRAAETGLLEPTAGPEGAEKLHKFYQLEIHPRLAALRAGVAK